MDLPPHQAIQATGRMLARWPTRTNERGRFRLNQRRVVMYRSTVEDRIVSERAANVQPGREVISAIPRRSARPDRPIEGMPRR